MTNYTAVNFHSFVDKKLADIGYIIRTADEEFVKTRLVDLMDLVNSNAKEYAKAYNWKPLGEEYFLNPLVEKWKYSFVILNSKDEICFLNFSSNYGSYIQNHCTHARKDTRGLNFAKLHIIKLCQTGLDNGFKIQKGYWPKHNNGSIILFLRMGWMIDHIREDVELGMTADLEKVRNQTYELVVAGR